MIAFIVRLVEQVSSKLLFSGLSLQRPRGFRAANRGLRIESEDLGEVEGVGAMDEGFSELPVDAELFQGDGLVAGGVQCQRVQGLDPAVDHEPGNADVEVVELKAPDRSGSRGVHRGEGEDQPVRRLGDRGNGVVDVLGLQGLEDAVLVQANADAAGRTIEDGATLLRSAEQRPQHDERLPSPASVESIEVGEDVVAFHLAQMAVGQVPLSVAARHSANAICRRGNSVYSMPHPL
ncbi:hypothetical protein AB0L99_26660 [Streptomyces sp. NPDC051954]|uniref:hypothetical protein n=1 Tax=Streptomyces sp. NPDC051954 TaxID=3155524 RepID=UPI0034309C57